MSFIMRPIRFASTGFVIAGSGLFDGTSTSILSRTPASAGNSKKFKIHAVIKRAELGAVQAIAGANSDGTFQFYFDANDKINIESYYSSAYKTRLITTPVFRDVGAYYAIDFEYDSTVSTPSASSIKLLINGVQVTAFGTATYPSQNEDAGWNLAERHRVGGRGNDSANPFEGYIARFVNIDGTHNDAMGEITDDGFYQLNDVSGLTFGTNGFLLEGGTNIAAGTDSNVTGYSPGSAVFSGTPYITRGADLTGISNGNTGLISLWVKFGSDGSNENFWVSHTGNDEIAFYRRSDNTIWVNIADDSDNVDLFLKTSETVTVADGWTHLLVSWDVSSGYSDIYIDDAQSSLSLDTTTSGGLDYTHSNHFFFADRLGNDRFNGEVADFWLTVNNTRFELTTESNRRKFISSDGYAVDLGSDGSTPTGTAPLVFFHLDRGEAPANFFANAGTGGTTSLSSSSLTEGSDPNNRHFTPAGTITATNDSPTNGDA